MATAMIMAMSLFPIFIINSLYDRKIQLGLPESLRKWTFPQNVVKQPGRSGKKYRKTRGVLQDGVVNNRKGKDPL
jgi:hypothetical protein